ncbi:MAG: hypothetical protein GQ574_06950 [Crocinitomix sp.]|nr:hypothetical protein [Crocinitomix sp.]
MAFTKHVILFILILLCSKSYAQIEDISKFRKGPPKISVFKNYFSPQYLDTTFIQKHGIRSITTMETLIIEDSLIYHEPQYVFTYFKNGNQKHFEYNSWNQNGGCVSNYRDEYGDSTLSVNHSYRVQNDSLIRDSKSCYTTYYIDDTLSRRINYTYSFDSLVKIVDNGIYDSKALERERKKNAKKRATNNSGMGISISAAMDRQRNRSMCILPPSEMRFENPKPKIVKDSLGRIIETRSFIYIYMDEKRPLVPFQNLIITYLDTTSIIKNCLSYMQLNRDQFEKTILETQKGEQREFPLCDSEDCLNYQLLASDFILGIPQNIIIIKSEKTLKYTTVIEFW